METPVKTGKRPKGKKPIYNSSMPTFVGGNENKLLLSAHRIVCGYARGANPEQTNHSKYELNYSRSLYREPAQVNILSLGF